MSILKTSSTVKLNVNRVHFEPPSDLRSIILNYSSGSDQRPYEELLISFKEYFGMEKHLIPLLQSCSGFVGLLDERMNRLVIALLEIDWIGGSDNLAVEYQRFVVELLAAHNYYTKKALEKLLAYLKPAQGEVWSGTEPSREEQHTFVLVHEAIDRILKVIPMAAELLVSVVATVFPYMKRNAHEHQVFVYNLFRICEYQPALRSEILSLVISRMLAIDVQIPREVIEDAEEEFNEDMEVETDANSRTIFTMDDYSTPSETTKKELLQSSDREMKHPLAKNLDVMMEQLMCFVQSHCARDATSTSWEYHRSIYGEMRAVFENQLLLTHGSHHVQFVLFYLCSLRPPTLAEHFLGTLWSGVTQPSETIIARQSAVCYIASLLARACYIPPRLVRSMLRQMSTWCHAYMAAQQNTTSCDARLHLVFYTVCQAVFYVVAFRHADLVNSKKGLAWMQTLGLGKLVTSQLNPLKMCQPNVAQNFAAITRTYQLAYCYTILERNARLNLPTICPHSGQGLSIRLNTFFPFDPYMLIRSSRFVCPHYKEYKELENHADRETGGNFDDDQGEEDYELHPHNHQRSPVKILSSPVALQHLISPNSFSDILNSGSYPGFKNI